MKTNKIKKKLFGSKYLIKAHGRKKAYEKALKKYKTEQKNGKNKQSLQLPSECIVQINKLYINSRQNNEQKFVKWQSFVK